MEANSDQARLLCSISMDEPQKTQELLRYSKFVSVFDTWSLSMGYSVLHLACFHNHHEIVVQLYETLLHQECLSLRHPQTKLYTKKEDKKSQEVISKAQKWLNAKTKDESQFSALHFVVQNGNIELLKWLQAKGADILIRSQQGISLMHVAAQFDRIDILAYLVQCGLSLFEKDKNGSKPLHWAIYGGAEFSLLFLLSQGADLEEEDNQGNRVLHLAIVLREYNQNSKLLKFLLHKNPDRLASNQNGQNSFQLVQMIQNERIRKETIEMLKMSQSSGAQSFYMTKTPFTKYQRNRKPLYTFMLLFVIYLVVPGIQIILKEEGEKTDQSSVLILLLTIPIFILFLYCWLKEPGYTPKPQIENFLVLCQKRKPQELCFECLNVRAERSKHCLLCGRCVLQFDHHCPWIDNCVGQDNRNVFFYFITGLLFYLITASFIFFLKLQQAQSIIKTQTTNWFQKIDQSQEPLLISSKQALFLGLNLTLLVTSISFLIPLCTLVAVQFSNQLYGKSTYERYSQNQREAQESGTQSETSGSPRQKK